MIILKGLIPIAVVCIFFHTLVVIDLIKKSKSMPRKIKSIWLWLSNFPIVGPIFYMSSRNYNNKDASSRDIFFLIVLYALLIELITAPFRMLSFMSCSVITFVLYFIFVYIISKKFSSQLKESYILSASLLGCSIIILPLHIMDFSNTLISFPDFLFHLFGIVMGYSFFKSSKLFKTIIILFSLSCCIFLYFKGYMMWIHKVYYGTFSGKIERTDVPDFQFADEKGKLISIHDFSGKYTIVDCWYTGCGVCFREFPIFDKEGKFVFRGNIENAKNYIDKMIKE